MPSRIDVELTSARPDGTWTWRAAGAREPRGVVESSVLPDGAKVGDVLKVEATIALDGIEIHSVVPARTHRKEPERIEILGGSDFQAVTTSLVGKRARDDRDRGDRRERRDSRSGDRRPSGDRRTGGDRRPSGDRPRPEGETSSRGPRREGAAATSRPPRERRERPSFAPVPEVPQRPKPKRLKPGRAHRQALMAALPEEQQPIADQLFRAGLPGVRQAMQDQNATLAAEGKPTIKPSGIESLAQDLLPRVRVADWLDRADAAKAVVDELDLRDLRSVVTTAADPVVARDDATRELAAELREALDRRQNEEHEQWLADITAALDVGRVVRALRLSSRPPKAGVRFPPELASRLAEATTAALTPDAASDRWAAVVEALAFSPVHSVVTPAAPPEAVSDELRAMVKGVAGAVPQIAALLGIEAPPPGQPPGPRPPAPPPSTEAQADDVGRRHAAAALRPSPPAARPRSRRQPRRRPTPSGRDSRARGRRPPRPAPDGRPSPAPPSAPPPSRRPRPRPRPPVERRAASRGRAAEADAAPEPEVAPEAEPAARPTPEPSRRAVRARAGGRAAAAEAAAAGREPRPPQPRAGAAAEPEPPRRRRSPSRRRRAGAEPEPTEPPRRRSPTVARPSPSRRRARRRPPEAEPEAPVASAADPEPAPSSEEPAPDEG